MHLKHLLLTIFIFCFFSAHSQQDMDLHMAGSFLGGKKILKVKQNFEDPYLWVLADNNQVYRINSVTKNIDDYTTQFSAYTGTRFIDIAGINKDIVFIATNSSTLVEYRNGTLKVIPVLAPINSIGVVYKTGFIFTIPHPLLIGTKNGLLGYNYESDVLLPTIGNYKGEVFEATYRSTVFYGIEKPADNDLVIDSHINGATFAGYIYKDGIYGQNINTVYSVAGNPFDVNGQFAYYGNQFWGTENGLFQNHWEKSNYEGFYPIQHYLNGINVNKVTSILGLINFGSYISQNMVKENLLVATSQGLYFSNSQHQTGLQANYQFFKFNDLANKPINDICVNANSSEGTIYNTDAKICEDGIWVAADDGLYFLKQDYSNYLDPLEKVPALRFETEEYDVSKTNLCDAASVKAMLRPNYFDKDFNIQWYKNGLAIVGQTAKVLSITSEGDYYAILYDVCSGLHLPTNHLKVTQSAGPVFTFNYPDKQNFCEGEIVTLETENKNLYLYRWYKNGVLTGNTSHKLDLTQTGKYKLEVSSCTGTWIATKEVQIDFIKIARPIISADKINYCTGDQAMLSVNVANNSNYTINWFKDGNIITAATDKTIFIANMPAKYTVTVSSKLADCNQTSDPFVLTFDPPPSIVLERLNNIPLCDGQSIELKATYTGGTLKWSTGETTNNISINQSGTYSASVTTTAGCTTTDQLTLNFFPKPIFNIPNATLCAFNNESITLTAPAGFAKYEWNNQAGSATFTTKTLGNVKLTVTDKNGCQATQTINITSKCPDIHIPNTFTPNGDGINDKWLIAGLNEDNSETVKVFNRNGNIVFQSVGYAIPWDGTTNGKKIPVGTYYYIITDHQSNKLLTGNLTVIY